MNKRQLGIFALCWMLVVCLAVGALATENTETTEETVQSTTQSTTQETTEETEQPTTQPAEPKNPGGTCGAAAIWEFDLSSGTLTISGSGAMTTSVQQPWAAYRANIRSVQIQSGITAIGVSAFDGCAITSVSIPSTVTQIGERAFRGCTQLTSLTIPATVVQVGDYAFADNPGLSQLTVPASVKSWGTCVFNSCWRMTSVTIEAGITEIPAGMFQSCSALRTVEIPAGVKSIKTSAFGSCTALTSVTFKGGAPEIDNTAFRDVTCVAVYPASDSTWTDAKRQNYGGTITWKSDQAVQALGGTFGNSNKMEWKIVGDTLYITGSGYMDGWQNGQDTPWYQYRGLIKKAVLSQGIQNLYTFAFAFCTELKEVTLNSDLSYIFDSTFSWCSSLERVVIPDSVKSMGSGVFYNCHNLRSVKLPSGTKEISSGTFKECWALETITIPSGVKKVQHDAFGNCKSLKSVYFTGNMPEFVTGIRMPGAFTGDKATVYYPQGNSTWTQERIQKEEEYYKGNIKFASYQYTAAPTGPTVAGGNSGQSQPQAGQVQPGVSTAPTVQDTMLEQATVPEQIENNQQNPTQTNTATENTEEETVPAQDQTIDQEEPKSRSVWFVVICGVGVAVGIGIAVWLWLKKRSVQEKNK